MPEIPIPDSQPQPLISGELRTALETYAALPRVVVATDFDGVLAPLVDDPRDSRPLPGTMDSLMALAGTEGTTVALVSGRALGSLTEVSGAQAPLLLYGSHGAESTNSGAGMALTEEQRQDLFGLNASLAEAVAAHPGARLEHKPMATAVHTRGLDPLVALAASQAAVGAAAAYGQVEVMHGKDVVEFLVAKATKGAALMALVEATGADAVLFLGDDVTDETVFARLRPTDIGIKVGPGDTAAAYRVDDPTAAAAVLALLAGLRG